MIRRKALELKYAITWLVVGIGVLIVTIFPDLIAMITYGLGIDYPINTLFFLGFCFSLAIIFMLTVVISRLSLRVRKLAQHIALSEKKE
jgi:hypothetical protein